MLCVNVLDLALSLGYMISDKVVADFNMFGLGMQYWIFCKVNCTGVVTF